MKLRQACELYGLVDRLRPVAGKLLTPLTWHEHMDLWRQILGMPADTPISALGAVLNDRAWQLTELGQIYNQQVLDNQQLHQGRFIP